MSGLIGGLSNTAKWAISYVLVWGALLTIGSFDEAAPLAVAIAWLIAVSAFIAKGVQALQQLGVI